MEFRPIQPTSTNKVNASINLANDGGSKSNTGYFSQRGAKEPPPQEEKLDEVTLSKSSKSKNVDEIDEIDEKVEGFSFFGVIEQLFNRIKEFWANLFKKNEPEIENIFEHLESKEEPDISNL